MKTPLKIIVIIAVVILVVVAGLTVFVKSYLTDARVRTLITRTAESSLHRKVSLGAISVSIFRGISVKDFEIKEKDSDSDFVKADAFVLKYQLLPLLSRRLVINQLEIESPTIVIRKNSDGSYNFSDMIRRKGEAAAKKKDTGGLSGLPVSLSVQSLRIDKARLEYSDPVGTVKKALIGLDAGIAIEGRSRQVIAPSGKARMEVLEVVLKDRPGPITDIPVSLQYSAEVDLAGKKVYILDASVKTLGVPATIKGTVNYGEPLSYDLEVGAPSVDLADVEKGAAVFLPSGIRISGGFSMKVSAAQKAVKDAKPVFSGEIKLDRVAVQVKNMKPVFSGTVTLAPEQIGFRSMKLVAGDSSADISGRVANYSTNPDIRMDVTSPMLNLDSIMLPQGKGEADAPGGRPGKEGKEQKEFGPLKTKITAGGDVAIARMLYKGITVRNLKAHYTFHNNIFTIDPLTGDTLSGSFRARSAVDLSKKGMAYTMNAGTDGVKLEEITAAFAPKAKGILFGSLSARADISGAGSASETIKRNLKGKGSFSVKNGEIKNAPIADGLLALLGLRSLKEIPIEKAAGTFNISGGVINLTSVIAGKDLAIDETGTVGMDQRLDMGILVKVSDKLSPKLLGQSGISQFLSEEKGWTEIPLKLTGTVARPSYGVDTTAIGKRATKSIQKKVEEEIFKAISGEKKKEQQPTATPQKGSSPEDLLKGFFK
ncbi:MAG: AsmA family protein [Candidatus Sulfobium sp.]